MSPIMCQCGKKPATIHVTELVNGEKKEIHLCEDCAKKANVFFPTIASVNDLGDLLSSVANAADQGESDRFNDLTCDECGMTFGEFRAGSRFGCPNDYEAFREAVDPLLERIHGTAEHRGTQPADPTVKRRTDRLSDLRTQLRKAVAEEAYERAARLRDQIYELKKELGDGAD